MTQHVCHHTRSLSRLSAAFALTLALVGAAASPVEAQHDDRSRVRFGVSGVGGGFVGAVHGGLGGISPRIGVQVNDVFAVYVQGRLLRLGIGYELA
ncbi:MAG: hypothetical protein J0L92_11225 [Deltaproteobacteria bacterium]|nr:hypothetical protein [Deltaproteobacteria bacterium]